MNKPEEEEEDEEEDKGEGSLASHLSVGHTKKKDE
jgi:hypothetical protein